MHDDQRDHDATYWRATADAPGLAPLVGLAEADVTVVGGGILGLTTALLAAEAGLQVVLLEARALASGTTGGTTGKVTAQNETRLASLRQQGADVARSYAAANVRGIELFDRLTTDYGIACDREVAPAHLVALTDDRVPDLEREAAASREAGLPVEVGPTPDEVPFAGRPCLTVPDQRQMHAVLYAQGLAAAVLALGGAVHEQSRVVDVVAERGTTARRWRVLTDQAEVRCDHVVLATRLPTHRDAKLLFGRTKPMSAVGIAARLEGAVPRGMYLFQEQRTWSIRSSRTARAGEHLVAVGMSEPTADRPALQGRTDRLADWVRDHFTVASVDHAWMAQDQMPSDGRPYVGPLPGDGLWTATGFGKWGLAFGTAAAESLVARVRGTSDPLDGAFATGRVEPPSGWKQILRANLRVGALFVGDRLRVGPAQDLDLAPGEGRLVRRGTSTVAVARTHDGTLHAVSATCTHLGCLVRWNAEEQSWDCGCHGSRFAPDGEVLEAPATSPLDPVDLG